MSTQAPAPPRRPEVWADADRPIRDDSDDVLGYGDYADALTELMLSPKTDKPLIIAVNGPWGSGKSSLAHLIENRLAPKDRKREQNHIVAWFNAWEHDEDGQLGQAFVRFVARTAERNRPNVGRLQRPAPWDVLGPQQRRRRLVNVGLGTVATSAGALTLYPVLEDVLNLPGGLEVAKQGVEWIVSALAASSPVLIGLYRRMGVPLVKYLKEPDRGTRDALKDEAQEWLGRFVKEATRWGAAQVRKKRDEARATAQDQDRPDVTEERLMVIFVDDLERCRPPNAVDILESLRMLRTCPNVVVVLLADMLNLAAHVEAKYQVVARYDQARTGTPHERSTGRASLPGQAFPGQHELWVEERVGLVGSFGLRYIQKIVQVQFDLPPLGEEDMRKVVEKNAFGGHKGRERGRPGAGKGVAREGHA